MERYIRNELAINPKENKLLRDKEILIVGCGGLGCYIVEMAARIGILNIRIVDGDTFSISNLNRQLFSNEENIGMKKVEVASTVIKKINSDVNLKAFDVYLDEENADSIIGSVDLVIDCLDCIKTRKILEREAHKKNIPMVHGAIGGWMGQIAISMPDNPIMEEIYPEDISTGIEKNWGNPPFTPGLIASFQFSEVVKYLLERDCLKGKICYIDIENYSMEIMEI